MIDTISKKAVKAGIWYSVGNILIKSIGFVSLPVFAHLLSVSDFGMVNIFQSYVSILFVVIGFALHTSLKNAKNDFPEKLNEYSSSLVLFALFSLGCVLSVGAISENYFANLLSLVPTYLLFLVILESFCTAMITFYNSVLSINYRYKEFLAISLAYSLIGIGVAVILILTVCNNARYLGRIYGTFISGALVTGYILYCTFSRARPKVNFEYWKYGLSISIPIIPHGLSQIILSSFDRILIKSIVGSVEAGLYSFAFNVGIIFSSVAVSSDTAWSQWFFDQMKGKNYERICNAANIYGSIVLAGALFLMLISPELVLMLGGSKYQDCCEIVPFIILAMFLSYMYYFPAVVEYYYKKTRLIMIGTMFAAIINVVLNSLFIPIYGYKVAAFVTVFCYLLYYLLHMYFSRIVHGTQIYDLKWQFSFVLVAFMCAGFVYLYSDLWIQRYSVLAVIILVILMIGIIKYSVLRTLWYEFRR